MNDTAVIQIKKFVKENSMDIILTNIEQLDIDIDKKLIIRSRFLKLFYKYKYESNKYMYLFNTSRLIITLGSISIPSLLSIETILDKSTSFWFVWSISLIVSILNAYVSLFKIDKNYYSLTALYEQMNSEFWQYNSLCGRYSGFYTHNEPNHNNQFIYFMNNIEKIQMRSIEETYIKVSDNSKDKKETGLTTVPPSINKDILENPPPELLEFINTMNKRNSVITNSPRKE
jgi:hypothetical protein